VQLVRGEIPALTAPRIQRDYCSSAANRPACYIRHKHTKRTDTKLQCIKHLKTVKYREAAIRNKRTVQMATGFITDRGERENLLLLRLKSSTRSSFS
jgi:hypothetical protein